jgi:hypothetical protein
MSEQRGEQPPEDRDATPVEPQPAAADATPRTIAAESATHTRAGAAFRQTLPWLLVLLVLVIAGVGLSPYWAPAVAPLLPWGAKPASVAENDAALAARVTALEKRPATAALDLNTIKSAQAAQAQRIDRLQAALAADSQDRAAAMADKTALQQLTQRVAEVEARSAAQAASKTAESGRVEQEMSRLSAAAADLGDQLSVLERRVSAQGSTDRTGTALLLAVLQMREAVEGSRPFPVPYDAFKRLAHDDPALLAGAAPLAAAAHDGVASQAVLHRQLDNLANEIARATKPAGKLRWWEQALDRLRGLVTIRRIGVAAHANLETDVSAAQSAMAGGDLAAAVSAIGSLNGANAAMAQPWLRMARDRLAAEAALVHLQELLAAHLSAASTPPPAAPAASPAPAPTPRAPS